MGAETTGKLLNEFGVPLSEERQLLIGQAYRALKLMTEHERSLVLCWFCRHCNRYVGPGDACHCSNDE